MRTTGALEDPTSGVGELVGLECRDGDGEGVGQSDGRLWAPGPKHWCSSDNIRAHSSTRLVPLADRQFPAASLVGGGMDGEGSWCCGVCVCVYVCACVRVRIEETTEW